MRAGELKHRITVQQPTETQTAGTGALTASWATFVQRSAAFEVKGGREFQRAQTAHGEITHLIRMRGYCAVTEKMRVSLADGRILEIVAAYAPDGKACGNAAEVWLACREIL
jgi:SPP1 family predicted phage head-tail adaptor